MKRLLLLCLVCLVGVSAMAFPVHGNDTTLRLCCRTFRDYRPMEHARPTPFFSAGQHFWPE